jgi:hypothetical protein
MTLRAIAIMARLISACYRFRLVRRWLGGLTVERGVDIVGPGNMTSDDHRYGGEKLQ